MRYNKLRHAALRSRKTRPLKFISWCGIIIFQFLNAKPKKKKKIIIENRYKPRDEPILHKEVRSSELIKLFLSLTIPLKYGILRKFVKIVQKVSARVKASIHLRYPRSKS